MAGVKSGDKGALDYAREATREWGNAARYGARALAARRNERQDDSDRPALRERLNPAKNKDDSDRPPLRERLNPAKTEKGGRIGDAADNALAKLGKPGKLASKLSLGSRVVERIRPSSGEDAGDEQAGDDDRSAPDSDGAISPVEAAVDVAVPIEALYEIGTRFEDYPDFLNRVIAVEELDDDRVDLVVKAQRRHRTLEVEIVEEVDGRRIEWECAEDVGHSGVITLHEVAPTLTHVELTVEFDPKGLLGKLAYSTGGTQRAITRELERFKAHAELSDEGAEAFETASQEPEEEPEEELEDSADLDEPEDEDLEEDFEEDLDDEEIVDEEELEDEEDFEEDELADEDELEEDEELEPVRSG